MNKTKLQRKIIDNAEINEVTKCWNWQNGLDGGGYGQIWWNNKQNLVHRMSYQAFVGKIPEGLLVLHECHNRLCVNPLHLHLGTNADNSREMVEAGRCQDQRGEKGPGAKLTEEQVLEILASDELHRIVAERYGVRHQTISDIKRGKSWGHLKEVSDA